MCDGDVNISFTRQLHGVVVQQLYHITMLVLTKDQLTAEPDQLV